MTPLVEPGSPLARLAAVCRANQASRERDRRDFWSVSEWRLFLGAAIPCGMRFPSLVVLLKRGATAEEIALEFGTDEAQARIRRRDQIEREAAQARRGARSNVTPMRYESVERDETEGFVVR